MARAYEIENWLRVKIRRSSWQHVEAYWYQDDAGCWRNQRDILVDRHLGELFSCDDWELVDVVTVFDWVLVGINIVAPHEKVAVIHECFTEDDSIPEAYKISNTCRIMTRNEYHKFRKPKENGESIRPQL